MPNCLVAIQESTSDGCLVFYQGPFRARTQWNIINAANRCREQMEKGPGTEPELNDCHRHAHFSRKVLSEMVR
jgi:hypothetical protein